MPTRYLEVSWLGGCTNPTISMTFSATGDGAYRLTEHSIGDLCNLLSAFERSFVLVLYSPLDPGQVDLVHS